MLADTKLDDLLNQLKDRKWHSLPILSSKLSIPKTQLQKIAETLHQQNIIQINPKTKWIKLNPQYTTLLTTPNQEEEPELPPHKPALATLIIPPKQNITIQNLHLTNTTQQTLEIHIRTCKNKTKLAINKLH